MPARRHSHDFKLDPNAPAPSAAPPNASAPSATDSMRQPSPRPSSTPSSPPLPAVAAASAAHPPPSSFALTATASASSATAHSAHSRPTVRCTAAPPHAHPHLHRCPDAEGDDTHYYLGVVGVVESRVVYRTWNASSNPRPVTAAITTPSNAASSTSAAAPTAQIPPSSAATPALSPAQSAADDSAAAATSTSLGCVCHNEVTPGKLNEAARSLLRAAAAIHPDPQLRLAILHHPDYTYAARG
jgi:hypothetical protein